MKKILSVLTLTTILCLPLFAQETPPQPPQGSFFQSLTGYFSSFNTNLDATFGASKGCVWAGADYVGGINTTASLGIEANLWKSISAESVTRNAGNAGVLVSEQVGLGYNLTVHDVRFTAYFDGGWDFDQDKPLAAIGVRAKKALTDHTFAFISLETQFIGGARRTCFGLGGGFTF